MKKIGLLFLFITISWPLMAQYTLSSSYNQPRADDRLLKQQVAYVAPGGSGLQQLWDFSNQTLLNADYELKYVSLDADADTLVGIEHRTMYYYHMCGDSLVSLGYENPTTLMHYRKPETLLVFPFPYGRSFTDYFDGKGNYCNNLDIHIQGKSTVKADATGAMVLPGGDTLRHVLRIYSLKKIAEKIVSFSELKNDSLLLDTLPFVFHRDSVDFHLMNDSVRMEVESWRWYADGYRYPVFETIISTSYRYDQPFQHFATSFYYPPSEQYYGLSYDAESQNRRDTNAELESRRDEESGSYIKNGKREENIIYEYYIDNQNRLHLNYSLSKMAKVTVALYDLQGRQLSEEQEISQGVGDYQKVFSLDEHPQGGYLLRIVVDSDVYGEKILN
ncbi:T9SS type A sorting domain-containing protein [Bacteroides sp.]